MKRWLGGLLAALMLISLTGCGLFAVSLEDPDFALVEEGQEEFFEVPKEEEADTREDGETTEAPDGEPEETLNQAGAPNIPNGPNESNSDLEECWVQENEPYTSKEDVACYIHFYGRLPDNFITKKEAQNLGWSGGSLEPYAPGQGLCIGGSHFGNYEGRLPEAEGRSYTECDIDTMGAKSRGAKRIVFSNDGLIYYTEDHYETFELLYGDEGDG